ncbi:MAG TPA: hypothetical protein VFU62_07925 [Hanamia sp.]|nr:hypothetical protein [Hanamia sp.]
MLIVSGKSTWLHRNNKVTSDATAEAFIDDDQQEQIKNLFDDITTVIKQAGLKGYPKAELLFALENLLSKDEFIILRKPSLRKATDVYIKDECEKYCSMQLSDDEMRRLWIGR